MCKSILGRKNFKTSDKILLPKKAREGAHAWRVHLFFIEKFNQAKAEKSDSNKYETVYESVFSFGTYAKTCMKY